MATSADAVPSGHALLAASSDHALQLPPGEVLAFSSDTLDGFDGDQSVISNNTTTNTPPANALNPPTFQELPPLPPALQRPFSPLKREEYEDNEMGATANSDYAPKSQSLDNSIGQLKQEMKILRNADLTLLYQLNELHQQILAYKVAMSERLERQSETNSEYSNSLTEDFEDFEEVDEVDEVEEESEPPVTLVSDRLQSLVINGEAERVATFDEPLQQQHQPIPLVRNSLATSSTPVPLPRSLQQLRQQLPPPPPRPADERQQGGDNATVHHWLDLNFKPDSYNC